MAATLVDRKWRASRPEMIEHDLAALWRDIAREARVARAVMSNLVVFRARDASASTGAEILTTDPRLEAIVARHPSRVVLIEHEQGPSSICAPAAASVGVAIFGPPTARYAIEQVAVRSACAEASLPSIVRRLIRGDLPTSVWWRADLSETPPLQALVTMGRQLIYDSRQWRDVAGGIRALVPLLADQRVDLADLNWRRLTPLRLALMHTTTSSRVEIAANDVRIVHRPGAAALGQLLAGWLAARLHWAGGHWQILDKDPKSDPTLMLTMGDSNWSLSATLDDHRVSVTQPGAAPVVAGVPHEGEADALAGELRSLSMDDCLSDAIGALAGRFASLT